MPGRKMPLVTNEIYHVFNRGIDHKPTFQDYSDYQRALELIQYYRFSDAPVRFSFYLRLQKENKERILTQLNKNKTLVDIISYCLMPNHFHFCLRQNIDGGISKFMSLFQNSFTRYSNTKVGRTGPVFLDQFKAVRIETDEQLLHINRYIHINPYTAFIVKNFADLEVYKWSSLQEYLQNKKGFCNKGLILDFFKKIEDYKSFLFNNADYQRELHKIKHLAFDLKYS